MGQRNSLLIFLTKPGLCLGWVIVYGKLEGGMVGTKRTVSKRENTESVQELISDKKVRRVYIDQCVKLQEKPTEIIIVIKFLFFSDTTLETSGATQPWWWSRCSLTSTSPVRRLQCESYFWKMKHSVATVHNLPPLLATAFITFAFSSSKCRCNFPPTHTLANTVTWGASFSRSSSSRWSSASAPASSHDYSRYRWVDSNKKFFSSAKKTRMVLYFHFLGEYSKLDRAKTGYPW